MGPGGGRAPGAGPVRSWSSTRPSAAAGTPARCSEARPDLRILGIDRDPDAVTAARDALAGIRATSSGRARGVRGPRRHRGAHEREGNIVGILFDLGVSSPQVDRRERGFSYWADAPLDMRMDSAQELTAARGREHLLRGRPRRDHRRQRRGAIRRAGSPARIVGAPGRCTPPASWSMRSRTAHPGPARRRGRHPARRTFQAIRMEVNRELPNLAAGLDESVHLLVPGRAHPRDRVPLARGPHGEASASRPGQEGPTEPNTPACPQTRSRGTRWCASSPAGPAGPTPLRLPTTRGRRAPGLRAAEKARAS